jgi:isoleucyl-tRNA synthetase
MLLFFGGNNMELKTTLLMPKTPFDMKANLATKEPVLVTFWHSMHLYQAMLDKNQGQPEYQLHDGPPYANGDMHIGHLLNRVLKDIVVRTKNMQGFYTPFVLGWDTHGLPIENYLTKKGVNRKSMSLIAFRQQCATFALEQVAKQKEQIRRLGIMGDFEHPYLTLDASYEAAQIGVFASMALKGLIYKGFKPVYWSPSSESALAEAEIEYEDVTDPSIYVAFDVRDGKGVLFHDERVVIWTTTPWTLPANLAISAHPRFDYGVYQTHLGKLVLLKVLLPALIKELALSNVSLLRTIQGKALEGVLTKHPFYDRSSPIILGDHVTNDSGTGFVHTAPGHGEEDFIVGQKYQLKALCPVDEKGVMTAEAGPELQGLFYQAASQKVIEILTTSKHLLAHHPYTHPYPHDWRTGKPLIYRATPQWFASIEPIRKTLLSEIKKVIWTPSWAEVRITNMIKDRGDWTISRQRAWGVPIPIIYHEDGTPIMEADVFKHIQSLIEKHGSNIWFEKEPLDLLPPGYQSPRSPHRLFKKETDIMDVWFDSGSSSIAVLKARGLKFPSDLYLEGSDQYRGWFNSSLILAVATEGIAPYQNILSHGFVLDGKGEKMSKSKGNGIDPLKMFNLFGADVMRLWAASIDYQSDVRASEDIFKGTAEIYRKIRNTFRFMLGNLTLGQDQPFILSRDGVKNLEWIDQLILNAYGHVQNQVIDHMNRYEFSLAVSTIVNFMTNDLSSFYLDITKDILYCEAKTSLRRLQVQTVLHTITHGFVALLTPIMPFTMEEIYQLFPQKVVASSQLLNYPKPLSIDDTQWQTYASFKLLRNEVLKVLEQARQDGLIGSSQEAAIQLPKLEPSLNQLNQLKPDERNRLFIVSSVSIREEEAAIRVVRTSGQKCERCWNYFPQLQSFDNVHVCERCLKVIR